MLKIFLILITSILNLSYVFAQLPLDSTAELDSLPFSIPDDQIKPLRTLLNDELQNRLEKRLNSDKAWAKLIKNKRMAVGLIDLSDPYNAKFARVNGDKMMYAASLPKLAVLLGIEQALEDKTLKETPDVVKDMRIMISKSDNRAATRLIDRVGLEKIDSVLTDPKYELYDIKRGGGLWMGKRYAKKGRRIGDPLNNISHAATATQVCRYYYLLAMGKLVSWERSREMLNYLVDPEIHHKFVNSLNKIVPDAKIYRKSGTWLYHHSDSALVWGPVWRRYIIVGLVEDAKGEQILRNLIPAIEEVLQDKN